MTDLSPGLILIVGAVLAPLLRGRLRAAYLLALPLLALAQTLSLAEGQAGVFQLFDMTLTTLRVDRLSLVFAYMFLAGALLATIFALHVDDVVQQVSAAIYAGSAIGAVFAGDLVTLFIFWEGTAIASVFLIWASRTQRAYRAGMRYLLLQVSSGLLLLSGILVQYHASGMIAFEPMALEGPAAVLILLAFGIKCAFPLLHTWLKDAYPEATATGAVALSIFTTKLAVYALARGFPGLDILIPIGVTMAVFPIFYAVIEDDLRRVLAYSLNSQLGFMVVGVGIGSELALNGTAAHAFSSVLYKGLLFMAMGAVLYRSGTAQGSRLGGLHRTMPWTAAAALVGAATISGVPLFAGFVSKSLILSAAGYEGHFWTWLLLLFAAVGAVYHTGIKVPLLAFFGPGRGARGGEAPANMVVAMVLAALLCAGFGLHPQGLYALLPYALDYQVYTGDHVLTQLQLLAFAGLAFALMMRLGLYPQSMPATNLDIDWLYRRGGRSAALALHAAAAQLRAGTVLAATGYLSALFSELYRHHGPRGVLGQTWPTGSMAMWATVLLTAFLIVYFL